MCLPLCFFGWLLLVVLMISSLQKRHLLCLVLTCCLFCLFLCLQIYMSFSPLPLFFLRCRRQLIELHSYQYCTTRKVKTARMDNFLPGPVKKILVAVAPTTIIRKVVASRASSPTQLARSTGIQRGAERAP